MTRTLLTLTTAAALVAGGLTSARAQEVDEKIPDPAAPIVKVVSAVDVDEVVSGKAARATTFEVTFGPGVAGLPHRHPGPIFGYVLEGEFEFAVGEGKVQTLKAGETFYEPAMALHAVSRNPSGTATTRVLAVLIHPRDAKQLVIPEPPKKRD